MVQISKICTTSPKFDEIKRTLKGQKRPFILLYINILYTKSQIRQFSADFHFHPRLRVRYNPVSIDSQSLTGLYFFKNSKMVTFGHHCAKVTSKHLKISCSSSPWRIVMLYFSVGLHNFIPINRYLVDRINTRL